MRLVKLGAVLAMAFALASLCACSTIDEGYVVDKSFDEGHSYAVIVCNHIFMRAVPDRWTIKVENGPVSSWVEVDESEWEEIEVGDWWEDES